MPAPFGLVEDSRAIPLPPIADILITHQVESNETSTIRGSESTLAAWHLQPAEAAEPSSGSDRAVRHATKPQPLRIRARRLADFLLRRIGMPRKRVGTFRSRQGRHAVPWFDGGL